MAKNTFASVITGPASERGNRAPPPGARDGGPECWPPKLPAPAQTPHKDGAGAHKDPVKARAAVPARPAQPPAGPSSLGGSAAPGSSSVNTLPPPGRGA